MTNSSSVNTAYLCQHWIHSYEEEHQADQAKIYRPSDFKQFPPSRFRIEYIFHINGQCEWLVLAPDCAHHFQQGTWSLDSNNKSILHIIQGEATDQTNSESLSIPLNADSGSRNVVDLGRSTTDAFISRSDDTTPSFTSSSITETTSFIIQTLTKEKLQLSSLEDISNSG